VNVRIGCAALAATLIAIGLMALRPAESTGGALRDFGVFRAAGETRLDGRDPYSAAIAAHENALPRGAMMPFVGMPPALPFWLALARLPEPAANALWRSLLIFALLALTVGSTMLARVRAPFDFLCVALAALAFTPITSAIALGQTALAGAAAAALALALRTPAALTAGSFVALAFQPNAALGLFAAFRRGARWLALGIAALYACGAIVRGPRWPLFYAHLLAAQSAAERDSVLQFTPAAIAAGFGASAPAAHAIAIAAAVVAAAAAIVLAWRARDQRFGFVAISCALPFACGYFHGHDFAALFAPAMIVLRGVHARLRGAALAATVAIGANWLDFAQAPHAYAQDVVLGCALIAVCLAILPRIDARVMLVAVASVALVAIAAWLGTTHPIPNWPDDFPGLAGRGAGTAAVVWHAELAATGLLSPNPVSALLRCIPLAGCALLFALLARASDVDVHEVVERRDAVGVEAL